MRSASGQPRRASVAPATASLDDPAGAVAKNASRVTNERRTRRRADVRPYPELTNWVSAKLGAAGVYLILLIVLSLIASIFIFSATQFQARVASLTSNGASITVWKIEQLRVQWIASRDLKISQEAAVNARVTESETASKLPVTIKPAPDAKAEVASKRATLLRAVQRLNGAIEKNLRDVADDQLLAAIQNARPSLDQSRINSELSEFSRALAESAAQTSNTPRPAETLVKSQAPPMTSVQGLDELSADDQRGLILNQVYELEAMRQSAIAYPIYKAVMFPTDLLILALVVVMGLLGSSLLLSYIYVTQFADRPFAFYFMRPFFGVITALVIYIVAKAGIPLIADPTRLGAAAPVNPYFISFLAILSGLMSERAIASLELLGASYFKDGGAGAALRDDAPRDDMGAPEPAGNEGGAPPIDDGRNKTAIERYVMSDPQSLHRVKEWLEAQNIDALVGFFVADPNKASERARLICDLSIPIG
jgi:hypothetical protein